MNLKVKPVTSLRGSIFLPASKSYSIRAFIIASCGGTSQIVNPSDCDDAKVAIRAAKFLGAKVRKIKNNIWKVIASTKALSGSFLNVGESGTVLRLLLPILCLYNQPVKIDGRGTLKGRPNFHLVKTLRARGVNIKGKGPKESVPLFIKGGELKGGKINIDGSLSSQFISALLIAAARLKDHTTLLLKGKKVVSKDYVVMTQQVLNKSGVKVKRVSERLFYIKGNQRFKGLKNFIVPSDYGLAAFWMVAGALVSSHIILRGYLERNLIQADGYIFTVLRKMGVKFQKISAFIKISGPFELRGGEFSLKNAPDLVPIVSILALFSRGTTRIYDIEHVRSKESDRISDLRNELFKIGARVQEKNNEILIIPQKNYTKDVLLDPHNDHRLAMAFSVLGLRIGTKVKNIECVSKSYPAFVKDLKRLTAYCQYY